MNMADLTPTFHQEDGTWYAIHEGSVVASGDDLGAVEDGATEYLNSLKTTREQVAKEQAKKTATHIVTPNGVKGEVMGRTPGLWSDEVTVRLANGTITSYHIHGESDVEWLTEKTASTAGPVERLSATLEEDYEHDRESLVARHTALREVALTAHRHIRQGAPYDVQVKLDELKIAAEAEARQVKEAIEHLDAVDTESFIPEAPFRPSVVEQADLGAAAGPSWLDQTAQDMIDESEGQDFEKLLVEGPALLTADMDTGALADAGVTREMALAHITSKTAGFQGEEIESYREQFLARTEQARRAELADRKASTKKEAAAAEEVISDAPDDALFM